MSEQKQNRPDLHHPFQCEPGRESECSFFHRWLGGWVACKLQESHPHHKPPFPAAEPEYIEVAPGQQDGAKMCPECDRPKSLLSNGPVEYIYVCEFCQMLEENERLEAALTQARKEGWDAAIKASGETDFDQMQKALTLARKALQKVEARQVELCRRTNRYEESSQTLTIVRAALAASQPGKETP